MAKDYRVSPGSASGSSEGIVWSEGALLTKASKAHWPQLWSQWGVLNAELAKLGEKTIQALRGIEKDFPALPAGRTWANYPDDPAMAVKVAVVNAWATHAQLFERRNYPDWVVSQLTQFGFWRGDGEPEERRAYATQVAAVLEKHAATTGLDAAAEALSVRFEAFAKQVEDALHRESLHGTCDYCPRFLR
jgi:hypothetical protein